MNELKTTLSSKEKCYFDLGQTPTIVFEAKDVVETFKKILDRVRHTDDKPELIIQEEIGDKILKWSERK